MQLPKDIRDMIQKRVERHGLRDRVITGYQKSAGLFWLAAIDSRGAIDRSFAEPMPAQGYAQMRAALTAFVRYRADQAAGAAKHRTLH